MTTQSASAAWADDVIAGLLANGVSESEIEVWDSADDIVIMVRGDITYRWTNGSQVIPDARAIQMPAWAGM